MAAATKSLQDDDNDVIHQLNTADTVEGTVFSKSWVFSLLVQLVNYISRTTDEVQKDSIKRSEREEEYYTSESKTNNTNNDNRVELYKIEHMSQCNNIGNVNTASASEEVETTSDGSLLDHIEDGIDMDEQLENDLCKLWDSSTNIEMCRFLHHHNTVELLVGAISRCKSSRLTEICVGIVGNMMCCSKICEEAIGTKSHRNFFICMLGHRDPGVLVECIRLLLTCLSHEEQQDNWLSSLSSSSSLLSDISYILENSVNEDLLRNLSLFIDRVLDLNDSLCSKWACESFVLAVCEAGNECNRVSCVDVSCTLMLILQSLTTVKEGVEITVVLADQVSKHLSTFLKLLSPAEETTTVSGSSDGSGGRGLMACLSVCECIINNGQKTSDLKTCLKDCKEVIKSLSSSVPISSANDDDDGGWCNSEQSPNSQWEKEDKNNSYNNPLIEEEIKRLAKNILIFLES